eukprot:357179-Chlamydomonas_euryale.AAC.9
MSAVGMHLKRSSTWISLPALDCPCATSLRTENEEKPRSSVMPRSLLCGCLSSAAVDSSVDSAATAAAVARHGKGEVGRQPWRDMCQPEDWPEDRTGVDDFGDAWAVARLHAEDKHWAFSLSVLSVHCVGAMNEEGRTPQTFPALLASSPSEVFPLST